MSDKECYKIVRKLYAIYTQSMIFPFLRVKLRTHDGFCIATLKFIREEYGYPMQYYNREVLEFIKKYSNFETREVYWFSKGHIRPRRKLLKLAIKNYKLSSKI